ncbi:sensor histidine kinase [Saccharopolyspora elongata]|uniref:histidine kinase n=1 Tax=Saccharopolyspora elongata TaxID=2530387 RepID=A0A4R4XZM2_9PSEU|nr:ATP-binding protein [Saccharopolyspora elongata]TDD36022.1 HAMP domain-containing protein [Saccharopolyspora elongata]
MKRWPLRIKLTIAYVVLTAVTGAIMLGLILLMAQPVTPVGTGSSVPYSSSAVPAPDRPVTAPADPGEPELVDVSGTVTYSSVLGNGVVALVVVMAVAAVLGWLTARRALLPIRSITSAAQRAADQELSTRICLSGPKDEIKELADAFDHMLARLERSFVSQRRFLANAAHELKTPVATQQAVTEVAMTRPDAGTGTIELGRKILASLDHQQRVLTGLFALAQNAETIEGRDTVNLADLTDGILHERIARNDEQIEPTSELDVAKVRGDAALLEQLIRNLIDNAFVHNAPGGWVSVRTVGTPTESVLEIANGGTHIDTTRSDQLFEPFKRSCFNRADPPPGSGLGLSVVRAISEAHGGSVTAQPRDEGGLVVRVRLPAA